MRKVVALSAVGVLTVVGLCFNVGRACTVEHAHYRYSTREFGGTADLITVESGLDSLPGKRTALHLRIPLPGEAKTFMDDWFLFDQGSSTFIYLMESTTRFAPSWSLWNKPHAAGPFDRLMDYYAWGRDHVVISDYPFPGHRAPHYIFLPQLYAAVRAITGEAFSPGMFVLDRCDAESAGGELPD